MQKYAKGGIIQPFFQRMECEVGEQVFPFSQRNFNIDWEKMKEAIRSETSCFVHIHRDSQEVVFPLETNLSDLSEEEIVERLQSGIKRAMGEM